MKGKRILGILILVLFLGTVFAGLAQGNSVTHIPQKTGSSMPSEIKPYIIVKRGALPDHVYNLEKWGGSAVQNDRYGIDLVVRAQKYTHYKGLYDELHLNATLMAVGDAYSLGNNRWLREILRNRIL